MKLASTTVSLKQFLLSSTELTNAFRKYKMITSALDQPGTSYQLCDSALVLDEDYAGAPVTLLVGLTELMTDTIIMIVFTRQHRCPTWQVLHFGTTYACR